MKDFNALQNLWNEQKKAPLPDANAILANAKKVQRSLNNKIKTQIAILTAVVIFILILVNVIPFKEATTFVGIALMAFTILLFSAVRLNQVIRLHKIDLTQNPRQLLLKLEAYYLFQNTVNTRYTMLYFILMNVAFALYFIEVLAPIALLYKTIIVAVYLAWMFFAYLYLGKKHKTKEQAKTQSIIDAIKAIEQQYES
jgi:hypothetical protein